MLGSFSGNVLAMLLFLAFQCCGLCVSCSLLQGESAGVRTVLGSVCGSVMLQWFPVPFAFFLGFSVPAQLLALFAAGMCAALCMVKCGIALPKLRLAGFWKRPYVWGILLMGAFFGALVWRSFLWADGGIYSSQATYGDMSMHLSFITSLARQGTFPPEYSLLPGVRLCYPFLSDSISASLYLCGASLKWAYFLPMLAAGGQVFFGFWYFARRLLGDGKKAAVAWVLFFFNGGLGLFWFLQGRADFTRMFTEFYQTPTNLTEENIRWVNVVVDMMLPQRATLFGWAVLFAALYLLYRAAFEGRKKYFLYGGVLAGLLPMIHTHSFLALGMVSAAWMLGSFLSGRGSKIAKGMILLGLPGMAVLQRILQHIGLTDARGLMVFAVAVLGIFAALTVGMALKSARQTGLKPLLNTWGVLLAALLLALPQLCYWTFHQVGEGFLRGHFAWVVGEDGYLEFYGKNLGVAGLLALLGMLTAGHEQFVKFLPALPIWFLAEFVEFQPNDYDNNKLLYVAFIFLCFAAADLFFRLFRLDWKGRLLAALHRAEARYGRRYKNAVSASLREAESTLRAASDAYGAAHAKSGPHRIRGLLMGLVLALCIASAALTMGREWVSRYELFGEGAVALVAYAEENLPADAVILTDIRHNNELASLAGRSVVCGSPTFLFFHGLDYYANEQAARQMYEFPRESAALFTEYGVDYVLVSDFERASYAVDTAGLDALFEKIYDDGSRVLYRTGSLEGWA